MHPGDNPGAIPYTDKLRRARRSSFKRLSGSTTSTNSCASATNTTNVRASSSSISPITREANPPNPAGDQEVYAARSIAGEVVEERRTEIYEVSAPPPSHHPSHHHHHHHTTQPMVIHTTQPATAPQPVELVKTTLVRDVSPSSHSYTTASYSTTSYDTSTTGTTSTTATAVPPGAPYIYDVAPAVVEPMAMQVHTSHSHHRSNSDDLRSEIRHLEKELARRERHDLVGAHVHRHGSRSRHSHSRSRDLVRSERLPTGEVVLYEETVEKVEEPSRGVRIEKDKRGRMSISVPRFR